MQTCVDIAGAYSVRTESFETIGKSQSLIIPAKAGIQWSYWYYGRCWIPTFVGMMNLGQFHQYIKGLRMVFGLRMRVR